MQNLLRFQLPLWLITPIIGFTLLFGLGGGFVFAQIALPPTDCPESAETCEEFEVFWQVWSLARERFVDAEAANPEQMTVGAINGMLDSLGDDDHTRFLTAEETQRWMESLSGEFEGIGAYIDMVDGEARIVAPIEGSPAEAAGLQPGDLIVQVDGDPVSTWSVEELLARVRGPRGTEVVLTIQREGQAEPFDVSITRATIELPYVSWEMLPDDVALIRLSSFGEDSADEVRQALTEAGAQGAKALIFDLRYNPGGLLNEAVDIASLFLPADTTVLLEEDRDGNRTPTKTRGESIAPDLPMVVLVNEYSASSSEILSGALQDAGRAKLIGETTLGTGTVLRTFNLEGGAQLLLGTTQWLTPDGRLIRKQGITPDTVIALPDEAQLLSPADAAQLSAEALRQSDDAQLAQAFGELADLVAGR
jgi:carboxyl-terminal processing protease